MPLCCLLTWGFRHCLPPMSKILERECGIGAGADQVRSGSVERAWSCWAELIRRARRPEWATSPTAVGRIASKRSTARRVTVSKTVPVRVSARAICILTSVNVSARATSRRNAAFLWSDSISVREMSGEDCFEALDGAQVDCVEDVSGEGFSAGDLYIDVRQCKRARDFAEERCLLVVGLDQREGDVGGPELEREAGDSRARAYVCHAVNLRG